MERGSVWHSAAFRFILFLAVLAVGWYFGRVFEFDAALYEGLLSRYPLALSGAVFIALYVLTSTFLWFGPKDMLQVICAVLFGPFVSTVLVWVGEMINAPIMFHLSRSLGREFVQQKWGMKAGEIDKIRKDTSFLGAVAWRLNPLLPFRFMDLGYGLTRITFRKYFGAIIAATFFRILWVQFIVAGVGVSIFKDMSAALDYFLEHPVVLGYSAIYFLAVIVMTAVAIMARSFSKKERTAG
jgi:uncharacterized membrane protein YdjX (TVP38/TMEM64 family)